MLLPGWIRRALTSRAPSRILTVLGHRNSITKFDYERPRSVLGADPVAYSSSCCRRPGIWSRDGRGVGPPRLQDQSRHPLSLIAWTGKEGIPEIGGYPQWKIVSQGVLGYAS